MNEHMNDSNILTFYPHAFSTSFAFLAQSNYNLLFVAGFVDSAVADGKSARAKHLVLNCVVVGKWRLLDTRMHAGPHRPVAGPGLESTEKKKKKNKQVICHNSSYNRAPFNLHFFFLLPSSSSSSSSSSCFVCVSGENLGAASLRTSEAT
jgi:hypothetical protein